MVGVGYDDSSTDLMYVHDTWDYSTHTMEWGGSYADMDHYGVTIVHLQEASTAPTVTSITPNNGQNTGTVHITNLAGSNFQSGATVKLTKSGQSDINATNVVVVNPSKVTCDFDLAGVPTGAWNVVVTNPNAQSGTLTNGFTVTWPGESQYVHLPLVRLRWPPPPPPGRLPPLMDADVIQGFPSVNFGSTTDMWVGYDHCVPAGIARGLVKFDISGIPAGTPIAHARLYLYLWNSCDIGERTHWVTAYRVTSGWSSSSVTWNTQPGYGEAYGAALIPSRTWGWYSFDVTGLLQKWVNGTASNYGLALRSNESSGNDSARLGFLTMNYDGTSLDPFIDVTYAGMEASGEVILPAVGMGEPGACRPSVLDALTEPSGILASGITGYDERTFCPSE
jgi:hypothetical protein